MCENLGSTLQVLAHLFVKVPRLIRQRKDPFDLRVKLPPVTTILTTKSRGNPATSYNPKKQQANLLVYAS